MRLWKLSRLVISAALLSVLILPAGSICAGGAEDCLSGKVMDTAGNPIAGASITIFIDSVAVKGTASNHKGDFEICLPSKKAASASIRVQSIAHETLNMALSIEQGSSDLKIVLESRSHSVEGITVRPRPQIVSERVEISRQTIVERAGHSLVASDPINAVREPQVIRAGSNTSSKIRMAGTSPAYYLNGLEIGQDPHHYGVFTIIPASIVDRIDMYPQGTPSGYGAPAVVNLQTPWPVDGGRNMDISLGVMDASATATYSDRDYFVMGSMRESVLDKLVDMVEKESEQMTIPPTKYQDIFVSGGLAISDRLRLAIDQFFSRDYLTFKLDPSPLNPKGINTYQHSRGEYLSGRMEFTSGSLLVRLRGGYMSKFEQYYVKAAGATTSGSLYVDLKSRRQTGLIGADARLLYGKTEIIAGQDIVVSDREQVSLRHTNWNFRPPDAGSDNPFPYQEELNKSFDNYSLYRGESDGAGYLSIRRKTGPWELGVGLRAEYFDGLASPWTTALRADLTGTVAAGHKIRVGFGTYYESPISRVLESYQVIVRASAAQLNPVKTSLAHISYSCGPVTVGAYRKKISSVPTIRPDLTLIENSESTGSSFIEAVSNGEIDFFGGDIAFDLDYIETHQFSLFGYYALAQADKMTGSIEVPYELNARHSFYIQGQIQISRSLSLGPSFMVRSGYAYTPIIDEAALESISPDSPEFFESYLRLENSRRFPSSLQLNLQASYTTGRARLSLGINNLTNHDNAIINTGSGYVYDAGIMPVLGVSYSL